MVDGQTVHWSSSVTFGSIEDAMKEFSGYKLDECFDIESVEIVEVEDE
jgi:hypothetical protein